MNVGQRNRFAIYGSIGEHSAFEGEVKGKVMGSYLPADSNAHVNHANIYPQLPEEIRNLYNDDYHSYDYYIIETDAGNTFFIGAPWINAKTIEELSETVLVVNIKDPEGRTQEELVKLLKTNGYEVSKLEAIQEV